MATATKTTKTVTEFTLFLTDQEARELVFYLSARPNLGASVRRAAVQITDGICSAVNATLKGDGFPL